MSPLGPVGDAAGLNHMPEEAQIGEIELHNLPSSFAKGDKNN
jgi:hypothetical protein